MILEYKVPLLLYPVAVAKFLAAKPEADSRSGGYVLRRASRYKLDVTNTTY